MSKKVYITTTLPYVNARPHVGHLLDFLQADVYARVARIKLGMDNVTLNVGTDEHGSKIYKKATEEGISPDEFVNRAVKDFYDFCSKFSIKYDKFYRTSDKEHISVAQAFWNKCLENGDIYKDIYDGLYCIGCEGYKTEKDLIDGKCPDHMNEPIIRLKEENYFFRLSKYAPQILDLLKNNPDFVKPHEKQKEAIKFVEKGLEDISISRQRKQLPWGIDVPNDKDHVMYVWFDALTNYVGAVGYPNNMDKFNEWWPVIQVCGPDNLRYQSIIWQAMLASADIPYSKNILVHGMILGPDGKKMSKTMGNVISPYEQEEKFGSEAVRFYMLAGLQTYNDSSYNETDLKNLYDSALADNYGNLLNRVIVFSNSKNIEINNYDKAESSFKKNVDEIESKTWKLFESFEIFEATQSINSLAAMGNKYLEETKPWEDKTETGEKRNIVMNNLSYLLYRLNSLYEPIIPESAKNAQEMLKNRESKILFQKKNDPKNIN